MHQCFFFFFFFFNDTATTEIYTLSLHDALPISAPDVANGQYQARINLVPRKGGNTVTMPVAFVKKQGPVSLTHSCSPLSFPAYTNANPTSTHCTVSAANFSQSSANASINVSQREKGAALRYKNVGAPGSVIGDGE